MPKIADKKAKRVFEVDGKKYAVVRPNLRQLTDANKIRRETFNSELESGSLLRDQLDTELRKRKLWSDDREIEYQNLRKDIINMEYSLAKGGIKLSEAKDIALKMKSKRQQMIDLLSSRTDLDSNTCEGRADAARFNYLFAMCLVYEDTGEPFFPKGMDDYILNQDSPVALAGASEFFYLISETDHVDDGLPENKFLKKFKFVDEDLRLVDKEGRLVDSEGRHINENGSYIKWTSEEDYIFVDIEGRPLDEKGDFVVEASPFLDDDGNPVVIEEESEESEESEEKPETKKRGRPKKTAAKTEEVS
ncbi:MAG: hypothetical protein ACXABD_04755 [Candidatus Thorarchaeota archaeon]|jgi:hypothetical protein